MPKLESWKERWIKEFNCAIDGQYAFVRMTNFIEKEIHQAQVEMLREVLPKSGENISFQIGYENLKMNGAGIGGWNACRQQIINKSKELGISEEEISK